MEIFTFLYYANEESDAVIGGSTKTLQHSITNIAGPVLIKTEISRFYLKQGSSTPKNLMGRVKTIWEPCVFGVIPSVPL